MTTLDRSVTVPETVLVRIVDGEAVLLNLDNENYYGLDEVSTDFWHAINESESLAGAVERLSAVYEVEETQLVADLLAFVEDLDKSGLVSIMGAPSI